MGEKSKGYLLLIGGAEDKNQECDILQKVVKLSGNREARLTGIYSGNGQAWADRGRLCQGFFSLGRKRCHSS